MIDIEDEAQIAGLDSLGMLDVLEDWPRQCTAGWDIGGAVENLPDAGHIENVVVLGMGGSGSAGDLAGAVLNGRLAVPFLVSKGYGPLPPWVGRNSFVIAVSYSGGTEETLDALAAAQASGARTVTISSGGDLEAMSSARGGCHVAIPGGGQPRASLGYLLMPLLAVLERAGVAPALAGECEEAFEGLRVLASQVSREVPAPENPAKSLARRIADRIPVVYGGSPVSAAAAYRFKCDLNEYAKSPAFSNVIPELNHNEIVGWTKVNRELRRRLVLVALRDVGEHERVTKRYEITRRLVGPLMSDVVESRAEGRSALARLLSLVYVTQTAAIYTGLLQGVDPGPVEVIEDLKRELARSPARAKEWTHDG